jgi:hypothetical protein
VPKTSTVWLTSANLAARERREAERRADQCGLAGSVGAEHGDDLAGVDGEVDPAQDGATAKGGHRVPQFDYGWSVGHEQASAPRSVVRFFRMTET